MSAQKEITFTLRDPPFSYIHLSLQRSQASNQSPSTILDEITLRSYLAAALQQYLGLTGAAITIDILKMGDEEAYVRVSNDEEIAVTSALSQWMSANGAISLRVRGRGSCLGNIISNPKQDKSLWNLDS